MEKLKNWKNRKIEKIEKNNFFWKRFSRHLQVPWCPITARWKEETFLFPTSGYRASGDLQVSRKSLSKKIIFSIFFEKNNFFWKRFSRHLQVPWCPITARWKEETFLFPTSGYRASGDLQVSRKSLSKKIIFSIFFDFSRPLRLFHPSLDRGKSPLSSSDRKVVKNGKIEKLKKSKNRKNRKK